MAKCEFPKELGLVRGTLSKTTVRTTHNGETVRVVAKVYDGKQHVYIQHVNPRSTPVSEKELENRRLFARANEIYSQLTEEGKENWRIAWSESKGKFNGKTYTTLHGYIKAVLYFELKNGIKE